MSDDSATATTPAHIDWNAVWANYVRSSLKGPDFAAAEGVDYEQLRWHVAHEHWRADRRKFRDNVYDAVMADSTQQQAGQQLARHKATPPARPGDELSDAACVLRATKLSAIECN